MHFCIKCICNILFCWTFSKGKCSAPTKCTHQINFCIKYISAYIFLWKMFSIKYIFAKENVRNASLFFAMLCFFTFCVAYILLVQKYCVFCFALFFYFLRCVHFPKENVQHQQNVRAVQKTPNTAAQKNKANRFLRFTL